jgi:hypothetical protein
LRKHFLTQVGVDIDTTAVREAVLKIMEQLGHSDQNFLKSSYKLRNQVVHETSYSIAFREVAFQLIPGTILLPARHDNHLPRVSSAAAARWRRGVVLVQGAALAVRRPMRAPLGLPP